MLRNPGEEGDEQVGGLGAHDALPFSCPSPTGRGEPNLCGTVAGDAVPLAMSGPSPTSCPSRSLSPSPTLVRKQSHLSLTGVPFCIIFWTWDSD